MIEVPDYDKMSELESKLFDEYNLSDDAYRIVCDLMTLKEKEGRYWGNLFPEERKPVDAAYVISILDSIIDKTQTLTSGNVSHHRAAILMIATSLKNKIKESINETNEHH